MIAPCKTVHAAVLGAEPHDAHWGPAEVLAGSLQKLHPHLEAIAMISSAIHQLGVDAAKGALTSPSTDAARRLFALLGVLPCSARSIAALREGREVAAQLCAADDEIYALLDAHLSKCAAGTASRRATPETRALLLDARALADDLRSSLDLPTRPSGGSGGKRRAGAGEDDGHAATAGQTDLLALDAHVAAVNALRR
jgi:hypothetical protein